VQQATALLRNATIVLGRANALLNGPAGQRSNVDDAEAQRASQAALLLAAQAQLRQSQINLDYTEIKAPVSGKIARSTVAAGNVVSPTSGALTTVVSQDPMNVIFPPVVLL
jgi:membrane fusion protein (multidrug efflux system)